MIRRAFERELNHIQDEVLILGSMVEKALVNAVIGFKKRDLDGARRLIAEDQVINDKRLAIEQDILMVIATQQPIAGDLRVLAAALEIVSELERIGDYAKDIARINLEIGTANFQKPAEGVVQMTGKAQHMLHRALSAFVKGDLHLARIVSAEDAEVDALYTKVYRELLRFADSTFITMDQALQLSRIARNLERAADRVTNICEWVVFVGTGEMEDMGGARLMRQPELAFAGNQASWRG